MLVVVAAFLVPRSGAIWRQSPSRCSGDVKYIRCSRSSSSSRRRSNHSSSIGRLSGQ